MKSIETNLERVIVARLMPDEDVIDGVIEILEKHNVKSGFIKVIGALKKFTIGYFDLDKMEYKFKTFEENAELISCIGNISFKNGEPIIHIHATLGKGDFTVLGGHLSQPSVVSITGEIYIYEINKKLVRATDPELGLSLLNL
jgi:predicted DNA-binding protein with PD1-like motif